MILIKTGDDCMQIINICENLLNQDFAIDNIKANLLHYFDNHILSDIYFLPKKVNKDLILEKLNDEDYINKIKKTIVFYQNKDITRMIKNRIHDFEQDTESKIQDEILYVIIGLDTTTIYSTNYNGKDVTVLLLEATNGEPDYLDMLLGHEYTHFIRRQLLNKDIFSESIGERFITEGIASNYSKEIVPNKEEHEYCIVSNSTVIWVKNHIKLIDAMVKDELESNRSMEKFFYMYANISDMPVRTGYVYGYLKVKNYLEKNHLKIRDILGIDWRKIINDED